MTTTDAVNCSVERGDKLPAGLTGESVCAAVRKAAEPALAAAGHPRSALSVRVTVESDSKLTGSATLAGRAFRQHHVAIADRTLNAHAIDMLANAIAADIASARK